mmetsp:Transcript_5294/g.10798  ORF Transcript_5294/g.10798 Transcript_5294/m.10798 type:complete len:88 (+) Transcript_5294:1445-1708(+)
MVVYFEDLRESDPSMGRSAGADRLGGNDETMEETAIVIAAVRISCRKEISSAMEATNHLANLKKNMDAVYKNIPCKVKLEKVWARNI